MEENNSKINEAPKMSYEELEEKFRLAINEVRQLRKAVEVLSDNRGIQRLEFLFKVLEYGLDFGDKTTERAIKEISEALFQEESEINKEEIVENAKD